VLNTLGFGSHYFKYCANSKARSHATKGETLHVHTTPLVILCHRDTPLTGDPVSQRHTTGDPVSQRRTAGDPVSQRHTMYHTAALQVTQ